MFYRAVHSERPPVDLAQPEFPDRCPVFLGSVALIFYKIVLGKLAMINLHDPVS